MTAKTCNPKTSQHLQETLIALVRQGDKQAFQQLYKNYHAALAGIIMGIIKDPLETEDLLQDTYLKAWQHFSHYDSKQGNLSTWLFCIARNTAIDAARRRQSMKLITIHDEPEVVSMTTTNALNIDTIGIKHFAKELLLPKQWQAVYLFYWYGYTYHEIADLLLVPLGTVKTRIHQSMLRLRLYLERN